MGVGHYNATTTTTTTKRGLLYTFKGYGSAGIKVEKRICDCDHFYLTLQIQIQESQTWNCSGSSSLSFVQAAKGLPTKSSKKTRRTRETKTRTPQETSKRKNGKRTAGESHE